MTEQGWIWKWRYLVLRMLNILVYNSLCGPPSEETIKKQLTAISAADATLSALKNYAGL